jgi:hypothetical protein
MKLWAVEHICHHFWMLHPPKSDEKSVQLPRDSFVKRNFLQNLYFRIRIKTLYVPAFIFEKRQPTSRSVAASDQKIG